MLRPGSGLLLPCSWTQNQPAAIASSTSGGVINASCTAAGGAAGGADGACNVESEGAEGWEKEEEIMEKPLMVLAPGILGSLQGKLLSQHQ